MSSSSSSSIYFHYNLKHECFYIDNSIENILHVIWDACYVGMQGLGVTAVAFDEKIFVLQKLIR